MTINVNDVYCYIITFINKSYIGGFMARIDFIEADTEQKIFAIAKNLGFEGKDTDKKLSVLNYLITYYEEVSKYLPETVLKEVKELCENVNEKFPIDMSTFFKEAIEAKARQLENTQKRVSELEGLSSAEITQKLKGQGKIVGGAALRVWAGIQEIMEANVKAKNWYDKTYINASAVSKHFTKRPEPEYVNNSTVNKVLKEHDAEIMAHHKKHQIEGDNFNRLAYNARLKAERASKNE